ncbi:BatD family protein [Pseudoruegeria sp. SK021]|uniref:BatD family protein n=1 Tax=Pseudoruegeria sp. SK021 TaxID=1933035 RepID=UPI000A23FD96|nr:BatD family protein [Pseudoruegeria sp. SK021]OSP53963.1 hypothetical protein BV911_14960 [Pseudoruegeria sp. SK021]
MRLLAISFALVVSLLAPAQAQSPLPVVDVQIDETAAIPGQFLTLRISILVPTWLSTPAEFPSLEMPNLRVILSDRSTTPLSKQIEGENWSGVSRRYLLSPMVPGQFNIPPQDILVTYAGPDQSDPITTTVQTEAIAIEGVIPSGAEGLNPFIAAEDLTLTQEVSDQTTGLAAGDSVVRTVTATVSGASPFMLPPLLPPVEIDGIRAYPDHPEVTESEDRGVLSGVRIESETLMAEGGGSGQVAPIDVRWFNLKSGKIEVATLDGFEISVDGPPLVSGPAEPRNWTLGLVILVGCSGAAFIGWRAWPHVTGALQSRKSARLASKSYAQNALLTAISAQDLPETLRCLDVWANRAPATRPETMERISEALTVIGQHIYGRSPDSAAPELWQSLPPMIQQSGGRPHTTAQGALPPLNPSGLIKRTAPS